MIQLKITRQYLDDLCRHFFPFMVQVLESRKRTAKGTEGYLAAVTILSVMEKMEIMFQRKTLTIQQKFTIKLEEHEAIIMMELMLNFPLAEDQFWRHNLRNYITEQLHNQLIN